LSLASGSWCLEEAADPDTGKPEAEQRERGGF
jgi:hypothetical protein